ncbi:hypothetical protein GCM10029992_46990 [Glycomyces albus]
MPILAAALSMASYVIHLATITLLLDDRPYGWNPAAIGLIGLIGFIGPLTMPTAGRIVDRGHAKAVMTSGLLLSIIAWLVMIPARDGQIAWLIAGIVLINIGHTSMLNASQSTCYELRPEARSRINAVFMTLFFAGGAAGARPCRSSGPATSGWAPVCSAPRWPAWACSRPSRSAAADRRARGRAVVGRLWHHRACDQQIGR